jgi:hypothetical protein
MNLVIHFRHHPFLHTTLEGAGVRKNTGTSMLVYCKLLHT